MRATDKGPPVAAPLDPGLPAFQPERRPVTKLREGFARQAAGSFSSPHAGDRQGAASRRGPLTPGSRPAHPPLRGPFAASGFLPDRQDAPSLARPDFRRRPVGSSGNPASAQRVGWPAHSPLSSLAKNNFPYRFRCQKSITDYCVHFFISSEFSLMRMLITNSKAGLGKNTNPHRRGVARGIRRAEERAKARTARHGSRDEDGCARDGASGRSVRPQQTTKEQRRLPDAGIVKGLARALNPTACTGRLKLPAPGGRNILGAKPGFTTCRPRQNPTKQRTKSHRRGFSGGIRRAEERTKARTARQGSRDEDGCARDGASGRSVRPQGTTKEQRRLPDAGIVKGLARAP